MRTGWAWIGLWAVIGCGKTAPFDGLRGGFGRDARPVAGLVDGGDDSTDLGAPSLDFGGFPVDTGSFVPDAGLTCELGGVTIEVEAAPAATFSGLAELIRPRPLVFRANRQTLAVSLGADTPVPRALEVGARYEIRYQAVDTRFGQDVFLFVQTPNSGSLLYAVWNVTSQDRAEIFTYQPSLCGPDPRGCGEVEAMNLPYSDALGQTQLVPPSGRIEVQGFELFNGASYRLPGGGCAARPRERYMGAIRRLQE